MKKNKISKNWINKQRRDIYVRKSKLEGYRSRAIYKLKEIDDKFKIIRNGIKVVDFTRVIAGPVAALILSYYPKLSPKAIRKILMESVVKIDFELELLTGGVALTIEQSDTTSTIPTVVKLPLAIDMGLDLGIYFNETDFGYGIDLDPTLWV